MHRKTKGGTVTRRYTPVLGLNDEPGEAVAVPGRWGWAVGRVYDQPEPEELKIELTVIAAGAERGGLPGGLSGVAGESV